MGFEVKCVSLRIMALNLLFRERIFRNTHAKSTRNTDNVIGTVIELFCGFQCVSVK